MFQVLVHASLYASLRRLPGERRDRFRRLVDRLRAGRWDGGARVKKLQGVGKPVFEARQDDRDRILFTLSRSASPERSDRLDTYLQIWDLVPHDRVEGRAARLNLSAEAEFLDYREVESEAITESPPPAAFGEVPSATPGGAAGVVDFMLPPDDWRPAEREGVAGCVRWYLVPDRWLARDMEVKMRDGRLVVAQGPAESGPTLGRPRRGRTVSRNLRMFEDASTGAEIQALGGHRVEPDPTGLGEIQGAKGVAGSPPPRPAGGMTGAPEGGRTPARAISHNPGGGGRSGGNSDSPWTQVSLPAWTGSPA